MKHQLLLIVIASFIGQSASAQIKVSELPVSQSHRLQLTRYEPRVAVEEMQVRMQGTPVFTSPAKEDEVTLEPSYRRPAGAFYCSSLMANNQILYTTGHEFALFKPFADYTFYSSVRGANANTNYAWDVFYNDDVQRTNRVRNLTVTYGLSTQPMPKLYVTNGEWTDPMTWLQYQMPYISQIPTDDGSTVSTPLPYAEAWAVPTPGVIPGLDEDVKFLLSSKTTCQFGRYGYLTNPWVTYYGAKAYGDNTHGWWFGKNASHVDGIAQAFEKPEHPYVLDRIYMKVYDDIECTSPVTLPCKVYKLRGTNPYSSYGSVYLPETPGELIYSGEGVITPSTGISNSGLVEFVLYSCDEDDPSLTFEYSPTIDFPILVVIEGYNEPEAEGIVNFTASICSDYLVDEGYGETAYVKYPYTDENGNFTGEYYWCGLNNFFSIGTMKTAFSIFISAIHPFLTINYPDDGEYKFPDEGGVMRKEITDGNHTVVESIEFFTWCSSWEDEWEMTCNGGEVPSWLDIELIDGEEGGEFNGIVTARVTAEPLPQGLDYREAVVRFENMADHRDYKFMQGQKGGQIDPPEITIAFVNAIINLILNGEYDLQHDLDEDGAVNIADINAAIDYILNH